MYGKPDDAEARMVGARLLTAVDRYLLDDPELELGRIVAESRPDLFLEIVKLEEVG